jgi:ABC-type sugar transport system ATPase subunit
MIELRNLSVCLGRFSMPPISWVIKEGQYAVLMGPTGSGKTTLLEAICGLRKVPTGSVWLNGRDVTNWSPSDRAIGYVPQDLGLFPTLSVKEHFAFALRLRGQSRADIEYRVDELAEMLQVRRLLDRNTKHLSGGEAQRVAIGRAISFRPRILLLDEPLSALDEATRETMQTILREVHDACKMTTLHVTHSRREADALADERYVLNEG